MSDLGGTIVLLTLICIQPALYLFLKSLLIINIVQKNTKKKAPTASIILGIIGAHLLPFFSVLGKQPIETAVNFFSSISYIVPNCSFNACSHRTIDYFLFPPDRFVDNVTTTGYWILIFAPVILQSIFWLVWFKKTGWQLPLILISTTCLYAATFLSLYLIGMYAPIIALIGSFIIWIGYRIIKKIV